MEQKVLGIIAKVAKVEATTLKPEQELAADLSIDSTKALQLLCDLEDELEIEVPEEAVSNITTVGDVLAIASNTDGSAAQTA